MTGIFATVVLAALVFFVLSPILGLPAIVGIIAAAVVVLAAIPTRGYGLHGG